jgi:hypothetical protein
MAGYSLCPVVWEGNEVVAGFSADPLSANSLSHAPKETGDRSIRSRSDKKTERRLYGRCTSSMRTGARKVDTLQGDVVIGGGRGEDVELF